jgi:TolB-like protein/DNA-binding winged helix-turn-helix (wHTH) protein
LDRPTSIPLRIGDWCVNPTYGQISRGGEVVRLEARTMRLLLCLAQRAGEVVSIDDLLDEVWSGVIVTPDSVYQAVASLRRLLGDDARQPAYIATVPRLGYRLVATVSPWVDESIAPNAPSPAAPDEVPAVAIGDARTATDAPGGADASREAGAPRWPDAPRGASAPRRAAALLVTVAALCLTLVVAFLFHGKPTPKSVAVLPFLDLTTQEMNEEYFADGMTEELIDKLSKIPGLRVPPPTSSFYFKGKQIKLADIARSLGVVYVLDGSVRKSDATLRVAARLIRADDGYVIWSETYDRPVDNKLNVQDDIATEVAKALRASINAGAQGH